MTPHSAVEELSSYLDTRLSEVGRVRVESHVKECPDCRLRLQGLRRVVERLEGLKRTTPPSSLGQVVERRVQFELNREGLLTRLEREAERWMLQSSILPIFALIVALAVITYVFALGVERWQDRGTRIILNPPRSELPVSQSAEIGGRLFEFSDGIWIERGLAGEVPSVRFEYSSAEGERWLREQPGLKAFESLTGVIRLRLGDQVVEVVFTEDAQPSKPAN